MQIKKRPLGTGTDLQGGPNLGPPGPKKIKRKKNWALLGPSPKEKKKNFFNNYIYRG